MNRLADEIVDFFLEEVGIHTAIVVFAVLERIDQKACSKVFVVSI